MDDLATTLIDVYETLRCQQELLTEMAVRVQAATTVLMHFEQIAELYPGVLENIRTSGEIAQQGALTIAAIDEKLRALRQERERPLGPPQ